MKNIEEIATKVVAAAINEARRHIAQQYNELLTSVDSVVVPYEPDWSRAVYHLYVIRTQSRDALQAFLSQRNITTGLHYPVPLHLQKAYSPTKLKNGSLAVAEQTAREILSLPMFPGITTGQQKAVVDGIQSFLSTSKGT